jgi:hypothetical protein
LAQQLPTAMDRASPDGKLALRPGPRKKIEFRQWQGDSSRTAKIAFIALKNLQNPRICHVPM